MFTFLTQASRFSSLSENHWAYETVDKMASAGIISGYTDGRFDLDTEITREQFSMG